MGIHLWREVKLINDGTKDEVRESLARKEFRPVAVAIIKDIKSNVLFVQSAHNKDRWYIPQGGIGPHEETADALFRGLREELGIREQNISAIDYLGTVDIDAEAARADKRGFTKGKKYFFFLLKYYGPQELDFALNEIAGYKWVPWKMVKAALLHEREEKRKAVTAVLGLRTEDQP